jgi:two-component system response regulator FixJ
LDFVLAKELPEKGSASAGTIIYVVDDDSAVRDSTSVLLESAGFRVRTFMHGEEFLAAAPALPPGGLVCDVRMPRLDGIALLNRLAELRLHFPAVVITGHGDIRTAVEALKSGAMDFLEKPYAQEALLATIRRITEKIRPADLEARSAARQLTGLTVRERDVLERLVAGMPNKIIAHDLAISVRTVEFYRTRVMKKLHARSLSELIRSALAAGIEIQLTRTGRRHT